MTPDTALPQLADRGHRLLRACDASCALPDPGSVPPAAALRPGTPVRQ